MSPKKNQIKKISVVVPVFCESEVLNTTYNALSNHLRQLKNYQYEIIFVDDGSTDNSLDIIKNIDDPYVQFVSFSRNFGHQLALLAGYKKASGDCVVTIDADLQDPPEVIRDMVNAWALGNDVVIAQRLLRKGESLFKRFSAYIFYRCLKVLVDIPIVLDAGDFRLLDKKVVDALVSIKEKKPFLRGIVPWLGFKSTVVQYERDHRLAGTTKYPLKKMVLLSLDGVVSFSITPLRLSLWASAIIFIICVGLAIYILYAHFVEQSTVSGWTSLALIVLFLGGLQFVYLGIIGEYIGRIYSETKQRPQFILDEES